MKNRIVIWSVVVIAVACTSNDKNAGVDKEKQKKDSILAAQNAKVMADTANFTTIEWYDSAFHDLGKVKEGETVEVAFRFKNTGSKPLVITSVSASCGCTIPEKPEKPFAPGEEGVIKAKFDSNGKSGMNTKTVYVNANTTPTTNHQLNFQVEVIK